MWKPGMSQAMCNVLTGFLVISVIKSRSQYFFLQTWTNLSSTFYYTQLSKQTYMSYLSTISLNFKASQPPKISSCKCMEPVAVGVNYNSKLDVSVLSTSQSFQTTLLSVILKDHVSARTHAVFVACSLLISLDWTAPPNIVWIQLTHMHSIQRLCLRM